MLRAKKSEQGMSNNNNSNADISSKMRDEQIGSGSTVQIQPETLEKNTDMVLKENSA